MHICAEGTPEVVDAPAPRNMAKGDDRRTPIDLIKASSDRTISSVFVMVRCAPSCRPLLARSLGTYGLQHRADVGILVLFLEKNMPRFHRSLVHAPKLQSRINVHVPLWIALIEMLEH